MGDPGSSISKFGGKGPDRDVEYSRCKSRERAFCHCEEANRAGACEGSGSDAAIYVARHRLEV